MSMESINEFAYCTRKSVSLTPFQHDASPQCVPKVFFHFQITEYKRLVTPDDELQWSTPFERHLPISFSDMVVTDRLEDCVAAMLWNCDLHTVDNSDLLLEEITDYASSLVPTYGLREARNIKAVKISLDIQATRVFFKESDGIVDTINESEDEEDLESSDNEDCTVCLDKLIAGKQVTVMPCTHIFHSNCLEKWLEIRTTCPLCRRREMPVDDKDDEMDYDYESNRIEHQGYDSDY